MMLLGPFTGLVADRMHRGRVLVFTQALGARDRRWPWPRSSRPGGAASGRWSGSRCSSASLWALDFPARRTALYALVGPRRVAHRGLARDRLDAGRQDDRAGAGRRRASRASAPRPATWRSRRSTRSACSSSWACPPASAARAAATPPRWCRASARASRGLARAHRARGADHHGADERALLPVPAHAAGLRPRRAARSGPEWLGALVAADGLGALLGALAIASRRGFLPHGRLFAVSVLVAPFLLLGLHGPALAAGPACPCWW